MWMVNEMVELKPCPFCFGKPEIIVESAYDATGLSLVESYYHVACTCCFASTGKICNKEKAIEAWNRRAGEDGKVY